MPASPPTPFVDPADAEAYAAHAEALTLRDAVRRSEHGLAVVLTRIAAKKLHHALGYAHVLDYAEHALDLRRRKAEGLLRLGRSLDGLPALDRAWAAGELEWTKARDLLDILTPDNEAAWVERAGKVSSRQLEEDLKRTLRGEPPPSHVGAPKEPARTRRTFELTTAQARIVDDVLAMVRGQLGTDADHVGSGEILAALMQRVMHDAPRETAPTGERHRVVVAYCPECEATSGVGCEVTDTTVLVAGCDAEVLEMREGPKRGHLSHAIPPAIRRAVLERDGHACRIPDCANRLYVDLHHCRHRAHGGDHDEANLLTVCGLHHDLTHDGRLAVDATPTGFVVTFPRGRRVELPRAPLRH